MLFKLINCAFCLVIGGGVLKQQEPDTDASRLEKSFYYLVSKPIQEKVQKRKIEQLDKWKEWVKNSKLFMEKSYNETKVRN